ncbi:MAG: response regulator [Oscillospiraceae bacterium]|nr:response regulator [Oscillospiraceae bacterium]
MPNNTPKLSEEMVSGAGWLAEQIPGGFFIYSAVGEQKMIYVNEATLHIFGCEDRAQFAELTDDTFPGLVHPDDREKTLASIDAQIANESNAAGLDYVEYRIIRRDGSVRWVDDYGHFAQMPGYGDVYYVFIGDITEKHAMQEELNRRAKVYKAMGEAFSSASANSLAVMRLNLTTGLVEDAQGSDLYDTDRAGLPYADCIRARKESFLLKGARERYEKAFTPEKLMDAYYAGGEPLSVMAYCRRKSGRQCFVKFTASALVEPESGDVIVFAVETECNFERVTEVLNGKVLAKQYDMVTYLIGDNYGVVIGDAANIQKGSIFPKERNGVYSEYVRTQVLPAASRKEHDIEELEKALSFETIEEQLKHSDNYVVNMTCDIDGEVFNKRFTYSTVIAESHFYILLKSDVTDVLRESRVRSELLSNALREAEQASMAKTAILSNMSHEIRTPLNAIIGLDSIALANLDLPAQTRDYLTKIGESAKHLLGIINDILDMSRIESGRMSLKNENFSLPDMIDQIRTMIQPQCQDKGLTFLCDVIGTTSERYIGDDMKLKQVLINILGNSVKFTEAPGTVSMTVEQTARFEDKATLRFVISDTGIGMDADFLPKIFEPFAQENSNKVTKYGSTGLGMAITKSIVEMMHGDISVKSEKGVGSEFTVTVTLLNSDPELAEQYVFRPSEIKVLVIDDDPIACEHAKLVLEEVGVTADTCLSGAEGLKMLDLQRAKQDPYQLVLVDWKMPELDGVEVSRRIREMDDEQTTIIVLSAYGWDGVAEQAFSVGVDSFMSKPLFASSVLSEFERILQKKSRRLQRAGKRADLKGKNVLLAEDMQINAEVIREILRMREVNVDHAENGKLALEMFAASEIGHYSAILMDVRMPVMDGLEATAAIRLLNRADAKTTPIIALSANAFDEDVQHSLQAGMNSHLTKPVEVDRLYETLEYLIGEAEG